MGATRARLIPTLVALTLLASCTVNQPGVTPLPGLPASIQPTPVESSTPPPIPNAEILKTKLDKVKRTNVTEAAYAVYTSVGDELAVENDTAMVPASTTKLVTAMAAISLLGPDTRFQTRVLALGDEVTIMGGGDPYLMASKQKKAVLAANLDDLAAATAAALTAAGTTTVKLNFDKSLFSGREYAKSWAPGWGSYTSRISALSVNLGKSTATKFNPKALNAAAADPDPALAAAQLFATKLRALGVSVNSVAKGKASEGAAEIASVSSAPLSQIIERMELYSENFTAEVIARHVAIAAGQKASFTGASNALEEYLQGMGLWSEGNNIDGGSGLSSKAKLKPSLLARLVFTGLNDEKYQAVMAGLPVAGESGTLKTKRFDDKKEQAGVGRVHAKTGTLNGVATLAGYVVDADGAVIAFAFMSKHTGQTAAYNWLDREASVIAGCGCQP